MLLFKVSKVESAFFGSSGAGVLKSFKSTDMHIPTKCQKVCKTKKGEFALKKLIFSIQLLFGFS